MPPSSPSFIAEPTRASIDATLNAQVIYFGTAWCEHCQAAQAFIEQALAAYPQIPCLMIEDGKGRLLGRSFAVKLWPTLIFLRHGKEVSRLSRPSNQQMISDALAQLI